jgi:hypothetical protein
METSLTCPIIENRLPKWHSSTTNLYYVAEYYGVPKCHLTTPCTTLTCPIMEKRLPKWHSSITKPIMHNQLYGVPKSHLTNSCTTLTCPIMENRLPKWHSSITIASFTPRASPGGTTYRTAAAAPPPPTPALLTLAAAPAAGPAAAVAASASASASPAGSSQHAPMKRTTLGWYDSLRWKSTSALKRSSVSAERPAGFRRQTRAGFSHECVCVVCFYGSFWQEVLILCHATPKAVGASA